MITFIELLHVQTERYCVNVFRDKKIRDLYCMLVEVWIKTDDGVQYMIKRCKLDDRPIEKVAQWVSETEKAGLHSPRPYYPGQACDGTISACTIALFTDACRWRGLNPVKIWREAYPDEKPGMTRKELDATSEFAEWQGVAYPTHWDNPQIERMVESLHNANFHQLATQVQQELGLI